MIFKCQSFHEPSGCDGAEFPLDIFFVRAENMTEAITEARVAFWRDVRGLGRLIEDDPEVVDFMDPEELALLRGREPASDSKHWGPSDISPDGMKAIIPIKGNIDSYGNQGSITIEPFDVEPARNQISNFLAGFNPKDDEQMARLIAMADGYENVRNW